VCRSNWHPFGNQPIVLAVIAEAECSSAGQGGDRLPSLLNRDAPPSASAVLFLVRGFANPHIRTCYHVSVSA
jgi:hypothetical protein